MCAVRLIYDDDHVWAIRQQRIRLTPLIAKFVNQREDDALLLAEKSAHLIAVLGTCGFGFGDGAAVQEVAVDLPV